MAVMTLAAMSLLLWSDRLPRIRVWRRDPSRSLIDLDTVARLLLVALSAGMPLAAAIERLAGDLDGPLGSALADVARNARLQGVARSLLVASPDLHPLAPMLARAQVSGASVLAALETFLDQRRRSAVAEATARARQAGVFLVLPLALLLLPGFGLVVFGPTIAEHLRGLILEP